MSRIDHMKKIHGKTNKGIHPKIKVLQIPDHPDVVTLQIMILK